MMTIVFGILVAALILCVLRLFLVAIGAVIVSFIIAVNTNDPGDVFWIALALLLLAVLVGRFMRRRRH